jgi:hypothetical protein
VEVNGRTTIDQQAPVRSSFESSTLSAKTR